MSVNTELNHDAKGIKLIRESVFSMVERITVSLPPELAEQINEQLDYGDSRSEWIREAIKLRLETEQQAGNPSRPTPVHIVS